MKVKKLKQIKEYIISSKFIIIVILFIGILETIIYFDIDNELHLYFLDIGQGDSILIEVPYYHYILVDGGESDKVLSELSDILPFWKHSIDLVIGTHADIDHIGGLEYVLKNYHVSKFFINDNDREDKTLDRIKDVALDKKIKIDELDAGDNIQVNSLIITVLWPEEEIDHLDDNQSSIVLHGLYGSFDFILTGDIESEQETEIIKKYKLDDIEVLKASHHGSKTASSEEFIRYLAPDYFVVSCGEDNKFGHPAGEVINRVLEYKIEIFRTDINKRIEFYSDGKELNIRLEKK